MTWTFERRKNLKKKTPHQARVSSAEVPRMAVGNKSNYRENVTVACRNEQKRILAGKRTRSDATRTIIIRRRPPPPPATRRPSTTPRSFKA